MRVLTTVIVGGVGAAAGFTHTHDWASSHGQAGWLAWADAVVIECLVLVAGFEVRRDHLAGKSRRLSLPIAVMSGALLVQMTAQVALAEPTAAGWLVAAMPAASFILIVKLALRTHGDAAPAAEVESAAATQTAPMAAGRQPAPAPRAVATAQLPAALSQRVIEATEKAHAQGRDVTAEDIRRTARVPGPLADRILRDLNQ
ncbi:DUF2637 domain-containing protein [Amycolatopsis sp. NPDC004378]